jgi:hypothetical protein
VIHHGTWQIAGWCLAIAAFGSACAAQGQGPRTGTSVTVATPAPTTASPGSESTRPPSDKDFDPRNFHDSTHITNPYFPMSPGTQFLWQGHAFDGGERVSRAIESTVTDLTKTINGVQTVVARDRDITNGEAEEIELTFFAEDDFGTVWYFGEYSEEYDDKQIVKSPLWLAGLRKARAGIMMPAQPRTRTPDYAEGWGGSDLHWNDRATVHQVGVKNCVPTGCYSDVVVIDEFNPDEPGDHQLKYYAPGVGGIRTGWSGTNEVEREELALTSRQNLGPSALAALREDVLDEEQRAYHRSPGTYGKTAPMTKGMIGR